VKIETKEGRGGGRRRPKQEIKGSIRSVDLSSVESSVNGLVEGSISQKEPRRHDLCGLRSRI
jgi:hypothetical protein